MIDGCPYNPHAVSRSSASCDGFRGVSVMEDEGHTTDHFSGISATDGTWHHIAVTWQSSDGRAILYDNGRKVTLLNCKPLENCRKGLGRSRSQAVGLHDYIPKLSLRICSPAFEL